MLILPLVPVMVRAAAPAGVVELVVTPIVALDVAPDAKVTDAVEKVVPDPAG